MSRAIFTSMGQPSTARNVRTPATAVLRLLLFALIALTLASCTRYSGKTPPKVVDGVIDVSGWDFERDGPVKLDGDWEVIPEGTLEDRAVITAPSSGDFVALPWNEGHHRSRGGLDVDASQWVQTRLHVRGNAPGRPLTLSVIEDAAESFYAECVAASGFRSIARAGMRSPREAATFREGLWPHAELSLSGNASCAFVWPRAAGDRVRALEAPRLDDAALATRRSVERSAMILVNLGILTTVICFALIMSLTQRNDALPLWSLSFAGLCAVRVLLVNSGQLFPLAGGSAIEDLPWWRVEYVTLWLGVGSFLRYGAALVARRLPLQGAFTAVLGALSLLGCVESYSVNARWLPVGQLATLATIGIVFHALWIAPSTREIVLSRL